MQCIVQAVLCFNIGKNGRTRGANLNLDAQNVESH